MENQTEEFHISGLQFKNIKEFVKFWKVTAKAFSVWYGHMQSDLPDCLRDDKGTWFPMMRLNAAAACFPEFFREMRSANGEVVGTLQMTPIYWGGDPAALNNLEFYDQWHKYSRKDRWILLFSYLLFIKILHSESLFKFALKSFRNKMLSNCNTIVLTVMLISGDHRGQRLPSRLIASAKEQVKSLNFDYLISPFRPSEYGKHKVENNIKHSSEAFKEYCYETNDEGFPKDAWLRALTKNGMKILRPEVRSFCVSKPISCFEKFKKLHKPDEWYESGKDIWECGETQTWYVDRNRNRAYSIEPNVWGQII